MVSTTYTAPNGSTHQGPSMGITRWYHIYKGVRFYCDIHEPYGRKDWWYYDGELLKEFETHKQILISINRRFRRERYRGCRLITKPRGIKNG